MVGSAASLLDVLAICLPFADPWVLIAGILVLSRAVPIDVVSTMAGILLGRAIARVIRL